MVKRFRLLPPTLKYGLVAQVIFLGAFLVDAAIPFIQGECEHSGMFLGGPNLLLMLLYGFAGIFVFEAVPPLFEAVVFVLISSSVWTLLAFGIGYLRSKFSSSTNGNEAVINYSKGRQLIFWLVSMIIMLTLLILFFEFDGTKIFPLDSCSGIPTGSGRF